MFPISGDFHLLTQRDDEDQEDSLLTNVSTEESRRRWMSNNTSTNRKKHLSVAAKGSSDIFVPNFGFSQQLHPSSPARRLPVDFCCCCLHYRISGGPHFGYQNVAKLPYKVRKVN
jgi:hypothetical protein